MPRKVNLDLEYKRRHDELERRYKEAILEAENMKKKRIEKLEAWKAAELAIRDEAAKRKREKLLAPKPTKEEKYAQAKKEQAKEDLRKKYESESESESESEDEQEEKHEDSESETESVDSEKEVEEDLELFERRLKFMCMSAKDKIAYLSAQLKKQKVEEVVVVAPEPVAETIQPRTLVEVPFDMWDISDVDDDAKYQYLKRRKEMGEMPPQYLLDFMDRYETSKNVPETSTTTPAQASQPPSLPPPETENQNGGTFSENNPPDSKRYPPLVSSTSKATTIPSYTPSQLQEEERPQVISNTKVKKPVKMMIRH